MEQVAANGYVYTGVSATEEEEAVMKQPLPLMVVGSYVTPSSQETIHGYAIAHGLPEIRGYYGYDFGKHQFIHTPGARDGAPDTWPSRKLSDIVGE